MGRDTNRQTRKIKFNGRSSAVYRPTDGQTAILAMTGASVTDTDVSRSAQQVRRFFTVISALFVDPADWTAVEDGLTNGDILMADINRLATQLFGHQWPPPRPADVGNDDVMLPEHDDEDPPAPTSHGIDDDDDDDDDAEDIDDVPPPPPARRTRRK